MLMGAEMRSAMIVTFSDPIKSGTMLYLGTSLTGCQTKPVDPSASGKGATIDPGVTSLRTKGLKKIGNASRATKTRIKTIEAIDVNATARSRSSATRSARRGLRVNGGGSRYAVGTCAWAVPFMKSL